MTDNMRDSRTDSQGRDQTNHNRTSDIDVKRNDPNRSQSFGAQGGMKGAGFQQKGEANTGFKGEAGSDFKSQNPEFTGKGATGRQGGSKDKPGHRDLTNETRTESHENYTTRNVSGNADKGGGHPKARGEYGNTGTGQGRGMTGHGNVYTDSDGPQGKGRGGQGSSSGDQGGAGYTSGGNFGMRNNPGSEYGSTFGGSKGNAGNSGNVGGANKDHGTSRSGTATQQLEAPSDDNESRYGSSGYKVTGTKTGNQGKDGSGTKQ